MNGENLKESEGSKTPVSFIEQFIIDDLKEGKNNGRILTRFPPEPNGYLHIGHAKAICLDFGMAMKYGGKCNLRFDDTNPVKEEVEYIDSIKEDIRWLGFDWKDREFASDYFGKLFDFVADLIKVLHMLMTSLPISYQHKGNTTIREQKVHSGTGVLRRTRLFTG